MFGLIATAIVLVLAFGSFFAMLLPLGVALFALGIALAGGELLSHVLAIAQFAPILGSLIGLGVGIDYALFIVTRSRQELKRGSSVEEAVSCAINTSGRAVLFAGSTVCIALLGMLILGLSLLERRRGHRVARRLDHDAGVDDAAARAARLPKAARAQPPRAPRARDERPRTRSS